MKTNRLMVTLFLLSFSLSGFTTERLSKVECYEKKAFIMGVVENLSFSVYQEGKTYAVGKDEAIADQDRAENIGHAQAIGTILQDMCRSLKN